MNEEKIGKAYRDAAEQYADIGVDTAEALERMKEISVSLHCWQGDDVCGFETSGGELDGGLAVTGNYPGRARNADELRSDLDAAFGLIPGKHRLNLHAIYAETGGAKVDRDELEPAHFENWIEWAGEKEMGMDFNPTFFAHPLAAGGFTLAHKDRKVREFWISHGSACRRIGAEMGRRLGSPCVTNFWVPDGYKDIPADRLAPRERLRDSLNAVFSAEIDPSHNIDSVESKLFGIGSESYVAGSHEFYFGYALRNGKLLCLDTGHFHPTEAVSDKVSSALLWFEEIMLHVSRGVRWDSDHVVILDEELKALALEIVRGDFIGRVHIGLDFFDASINRVAAWAIGARNTLKAFLLAMLEPSEELRRLELDGDYTSRLALMEELKAMPFGAVWDYYCMTSGAPAAADWIDVCKRYETDVLAIRQ